MAGIAPFPVVAARALSRGVSCPVLGVVAGNPNLGGKSKFRFAWSRGVGGCSFASFGGFGAGSGEFHVHASNPDFSQNRANLA